MAADIRKVYPDMFEETYSSLLHAMDPDRPKEEWQRIFEPGWPSPEEHVGYGLFAGEEMVGFAGFLFAEMSLGGETQKLCNFTSWVAKEEYQAESVALLLPLRSLHGYTITNFSPTPKVQEVFKRLGYQLLDEYTTVARPTFGFGGRAGRGRFEILTEPREIEKTLDEELGRVYQDHAPYGHHMVVQSEEGYSYGIFTLRRRRRLRTALFHHLTSPAVFVSAIPAIRAHLFRRYRGVLLECDSRLLGDRAVPGSYRIHRLHLPPPRLFRSESLEPADVPNLYSELILLNLE